MASVGRGGQTIVKRLSNSGQTIVVTKGRGGRIYRKLHPAVNCGPKYWQSIGKQSASNRQAIVEP